MGVGIDTMSLYRGERMQIGNAKWLRLREEHQQAGSTGVKLSDINAQDQQDAKWVHPKGDK